MNLTEKFIKYAENQGYKVTIEQSDEPDTFEKIFGVSFVKERSDNMKIFEINDRLNELKDTQRSLLSARKKFEDCKDSCCENYLNWYTLTTAIECVGYEILRLENTEWVEATVKR